MQQIKKMKELVLLIGHGSRNEQGNIQILNFTELLKQRQENLNIRVCYIELADYLIAQGLNDAANEAKKVLIIPLVLNAAGHVKDEIPEFIEQAQLEYPETEFVYLEHLGANQLILTILKRKLLSAMQLIAMPDPKTTGVVLLARGSSDALANGEMAKMTRWLFEETEHELVDIAFTGVTYPRLESSVQRQIKLGMKQIIILPYYLFDGVLIQRIGQQYERLKKQYPQITFSKSDYFGFEEEIFQLVEQRIIEAQ